MLANVTIISVDVFKLDFPLSWSERIFRENASQIIFPKLDKIIMIVPQDSSDNENSVNISPSISVLKFFIFSMLTSSVSPRLWLVLQSNNSIWSRVFHPPLKRLAIISCDMVNFMTSESLNKYINWYAFQIELLDLI